MEGKTKWIWHNLSKEEKKALDELALDNNIVIKEADKGGGIVILKKSDYMLEIDR